MVDQNPELEEWRVDLAGTDFDLGHLAESLTKPTAQVKRREEGNGYYLISDTFADLDDAGEVRAKAAVLLGQINGAARIESSVFENVTLGSAVVRVGGKKRSITVFTESGRARARMGPVKLFISNPNGSIQELGGCPTLAERALELGRTDEAVAKALRLFEQPNWTKLANILEIIESDSGPVSKTGWASRNEISRFNQSANSWASAGVDARHSNERTAPPPKPLTFEDAAVFIRRVFESWLESKLLTQ